MDLCVCRVNTEIKLQTEKKAVTMCLNCGSEMFAQIEELCVLFFLSKFFSTNPFGCDRECGGVIYDRLK